MKRVLTVIRHVLKPLLSKSFCGLFLTIFILNQLAYSLISGSSFLAYPLWIVVLSLIISLALYILFREKIDNLYHSYIYPLFSVCIIILICVLGIIDLCNRFTILF